MLIVLISSGLLLGCDSSVNEPESSREIRSNEIDTYMEATISGSRWIAVNPIMVGVREDGELAVSIFGENDAGDRLELVLRGDLTEVTYVIRSEQLMRQSFRPAGSSAQNQFQSSDTGTVTLVVVNNTVIEGTFAFDASSPGNAQSISVKSGRFRVARFD